MTVGTLDVLSIVASYDKMDEQAFVGDIRRTALNLESLLSHTWRRYHELKDRDNQPYSLRIAVSCDPSLAVNVGPNKNQELAYFCDHCKKWVMGAPKAVITDDGTIDLICRLYDCTTGNLAV